MLTGIVQQLFLTLFCTTTRHPVLLFSYEHVTKTDSDFFVDVLADYLSIELDPARKHSAVESIDPARGYAGAPGIRGHIDHLSSGEIRGWVVDTRRPERSVTLKVRAADRIGATVQANIKRPDVRNAGFHRTGMCGFRVAFAEPLREEELKTVNLMDADTQETATSV